MQITLHFKDSFSVSNIINKKQRFILQYIQKDSKDLQVLYSAQMYSDNFATNSKHCKTKQSPL